MSMVNNTILNSTKTTRVVNAQAAGITNVNGSIVDMQGFEGIAFTTMFGTLTAGAITGIKVQEGNDSALADAADLAGSALAIPDTGSNKVLITEIFKPLKRYVRLVITRSTQNAVIDGAIAQQFAARVEPPVQDTTVQATKYQVSPAEGTP